MPLIASSSWVVTNRCGISPYVLVADHLADRLDHRLVAAQVEVGALALDHHQRDAVDEQHQVGPAGGVAALPLDAIFLGDMVDVALGVLPVDIVQRVALAVAIDGLGQAGAQGQQLVDPLAGELQALGMAH